METKFHIVANDTHFFDCRTRRTCVRIAPDLRKTDGLN